PQPSSTCSTGPYFPTVAGAGVFRFQDGSLLTVSLTEGAICIDPEHQVAHFTVSYKITGGTGRFQGASGTLTLTGAVRAVLISPSGGAPLLTNTGELEGTISGASIREQRQDERR